MKPSVPVVVVPQSMGGFVVFEAPYDVAVSWTNKEKPAPEACGDKEALLKFLRGHFTDWRFHAVDHGGHA